MAFKEDFDAFLEVTDFGEEIQWNADIFNGIFDNATYQVDNGESSVPVDVQQPILLAKDEAIVGMVQGEIILRVSTGVSYTVQGFAPDGTGMTDLKLEKVAA